MALFGYIYYRCRTSSPSHWVLTVASTALWSRCLTACSEAPPPAAREITLTRRTVSKSRGSSTCDNWESLLLRFRWLRTSQQERKQTVNRCSSFEALSSPDPSPGSQLSTTQEITSARSPSDLPHRGQIPALHLRHGLLHADKGPLGKSTGSGFDIVQKKNTEKRTSEWGGEIHRVSKTPQ